MRLMKKRYKKNKVYHYKYYFLGFPSKINKKIEMEMNKDFEIIDFTCEKKNKKEYVHITLSRDITDEPVP
jgi:hypothetical protein